MWGVNNGHYLAFFDSISRGTKFGVTLSSAYGIWKVSHIRLQHNVIKDNGDTRVTASRSIVVFHNLHSCFDLAVRRSTRNVTIPWNAITVVYGFVTAIHPGIARSTARSWRAPHVFLSAVISRGTPIDDGVPLSLISRHSTTSVHSSSSYGSFLSLGTITDRDTNQDPTVHCCRAWATI